MLLGVVVVTAADILAVFLGLTHVEVLLAVVIVTLAVDTVVIVVVGGVDGGAVVFEEVACPKTEFRVPCFELSDRQATSSVSLSNESFDILS